MVAEEEMRRNYISLPRKVLTSYTAVATLEFCVRITIFCLKSHQLISVDAWVPSSGISMLG